MTRKMSAKMIEFLKKLKKKKQCDERAENTHHALF